MGRTGERKNVAHHKRGLTFGLIVFFCLFTGAFFFLRSPYFDIREFQVEGNVRVSRDDIVARTGVNATSIFAFDVDKAARLIELAPWVETAKVTRRLPGTVSIYVAERVPVAFSPQEDGMWLVDAAGRVLAKDDGAWEGLVALTGPTAEMAPGQFLSQENYGWGLRVLRVLRPLSRKKLTEISVQDGEVTLILDDGCRVLLGRERSNPEELSRLLESILQELTEGGRIAEHVDLRFDKPAVKEQFSVIPKR